MNLNNINSLKIAKKESAISLLTRGIYELHIFYQQNKNSIELLYDS